jgi:multidrug resistance efflux pump
MKPAALIRALLPVVVMAAVSAGLLSASFILRRSARARDVPIPTPSSPPAKAASEAGGVVCFGTVDLKHGVTSLYPLQPGRVAEVLVHENQVVLQGAELLRLEDTASRSHLAEAEAALEMSRLQLQQARKLPEQQQRRIARQQSVLQIARSRLAAARELLARRKKLALQPSAIAAADVSASEMQVSELEELERVETDRLAELQAEDADGEAHRAEYALAMAEARRDQARLALDECRLKAPRPGMILRILVGPGDVLGAEQGQPAVLFAADGPQVIRATVEQEFTPRIKEGERALVHDEADPSLSWRGRVERLAGWYSQRRTVMHDPSQMSDVRTLECVVVLEPGQPRLRLGQGVRVSLGAVPP